LTPADDILRAAALTAAAATAASTLRAALLRSLRRLRSLCRGALLPGVLTLVRQKRARRNHRGYNDEACQSTVIHDIHYYQSYT
jgi:hypothetical protein